MKTETDSTLPPAVVRFAALAVRRGVSLGVLLSTHRRDFELVLAAAARTFQPDRGYSEREVNDLLRGFLEGAGAMLGTDHVELRRWLVDDGWLERDGYGRCYRRTAPTRERGAVLAALAAVDLATIAAVARADDARRRAKRKAQWNAAAGHGPGA